MDTHKVGGYELVTGYDDIVQNILAFQQVLHKNSTAYERFSQFRHWYVLPQGDKRLFGPSKFIGYKGTTTANYEPHPGCGQDGRKTERKLKRYSDLLDKGRGAFARLYEELARFARTVGKTLHPFVQTGPGGIHVFKLCYQTKQRREQ